MILGSGHLKIFSETPGEKKRRGSLKTTRTKRIGWRRSDNVSITVYLCLALPPMGKPLPRRVRSSCRPRPIFSPLVHRQRGLSALMQFRYFLQTAPRLPRLGTGASRVYLLRGLQCYSKSGIISSLRNARVQTSACRLRLRRLTRPLRLREPFGERQTLYH